LRSLRVGLLLGVVGLSATRAFAYHFGTVPLSDVQYAAQNYNQCPNQLTPPMLTALMLSPTWWEVAEHDGERTPSPMTLGRADPNDLFYPPQNNTFGTPYHRVFWHAGIGAWQLDDQVTGHWGTDLSVEKFNTRDAAIQVAMKMSEQYCKHTDPPLSRLAALRSFCACATDLKCSITHPDTPDIANCEYTYNNLLNGQAVGPDPLYPTDRFGGGKPRVCSLAGQSTAFSCTYVDPANAQGDIAWTGSVDPSSVDPSTGKLKPPLALPFYVYHQLDPAPVPPAEYEWRYWMAEATTLDKDFAARRGLKVGSTEFLPDSTPNLKWFPPGPGGSVPNLRASTYALCDVSAARGACGGNTIWIIATMDGVPWPESLPALYDLTWRVSGPDNSSGPVVPVGIPGQPPGTYTVQYVSGGPSASVLPISTMTKTLTQGGSITFTFNFSSNSCRTLVQDRKRDRS
jgi:hypothetical protein